MVFELESKTKLSKEKKIVICLHIMIILTIIILTKYLITDTTTKPQQLADVSNATSTVTTTNNQGVPNGNDKVVVNQPPTEIDLPEVIPFTNITLESKATLVWDINKQEAIWQKQSEKRLPLASLTKLMTVLLAYELIEDDVVITVDSTAISQLGESILRLGEKIDRQTLEDLVLMTSSNDGAYALAETVGDILAPNGGVEAFVKAMNVRAKEMGLENTEFLNPTGLDINDLQPGSYGTAKEMAKLVEYIIENYPSILDSSSLPKITLRNKFGQSYTVNNTNKYIEEIPGLLGSKTGFTDIAGGNLVVVFNAGLNRPIVMVVLGSTYEGRFRDIMKLVKETNIFLQYNSL